MLQKRHFLTLLIFLLAFSAVVAQDEPDTDLQTYVSYDGWLSLEYPAEWVVDREGDDFGLGFFSIASSQETLNVLRQNSDQEENDPVPAGEVGIIIIRPRFIERTIAPINPDMSLSEILLTFLNDPEVADELTTDEITIAGNPALRVDSGDETSEGIILAIEFAPRINLLLIASAAPGDLAQYEDAIMALAESIHYGGQAETVLYHDYSVWAAEWSPDSSRFYTRVSEFGEDLDFVYVWSAKTHEQLFSTEGSGAAFSPDSSRIAVIQEHSTPILDATTGEVLVGAVGKAARVRWNSDGTQLMSSNTQDGFVAVWDAATGRQLFSFNQSTFNIDWAFNESIIVTSIFGDEAAVRHWDAETGDLLFEVAGANTLSLNNTFSRALYVEAETTLVMVEYPSGEEVWRVQFERDDDLFNGFIAPRWTNSDTRIYTHLGSCPPSGDNCTLSGLLLDAETGEMIFRTPPEDTFRDGVYLANNQIVGGLRGPDLIRVWETNTGEVVKDIPTASFIYRMVYAPQLNRLFAFEDTGLVRIYDVATWEQIMVLPHTDRVRFAFVDPENTDHFITTTEDGAYTVWDLASGRELLRIGHAPRGSSDVSAFAFLSPDTKQLLSFVSGGSGARVFSRAALIQERLDEFAAEPFTVSELADMAAQAASEENYQQAVDLYTEGLRLDPDAARLLNDRAIAHYRLGNSSQTLRDLELAVTLYPDYVQATRNLGDIWRLSGGQGGLERAIDYYTQAIILDPTDATLYNIRGFAHTNLGDYEAAIADFDAATVLDADYPTPYSNRAFVYSFMEEYEKSFENLEIYLELIGGEANASADVLQLLETLQAELEE